jgi:hypothetical protein
MRIRRAASTSTLVCLAVAALLAIGVTACGGFGGGSAAWPATTVTESAPASHAPAANSSAETPASSVNNTPAGASAPTTGRLPDYRPSTVVSQSGTTTVLKSPGSVATIGAFYQNALAKGGWDAASSSMGSFHASFTAHRAREGMSISVCPAGADLASRSAGTPSDGDAVHREHPGRKSGHRPSAG